MRHAPSFVVAPMGIWCLTACLENVTNPPADAQVDRNQDAVIDTGSSTGPDARGFSTYPISEGACDLWARVPPTGGAPPVVSSGDLWYAVAGELLQMAPGGPWTRTMAGNVRLAQTTRFLAAVRDQSVFVRRNGTWTDVWEPNLGSIGSVKSTGSHLIVITAAGAIVFYDGTQWTSIGTFPHGAIADVWGRSDALYVVQANAVWHYNGSAWQPLTSPAGSTHTTVTGTADTTFILTTLPSLYRINGNVLELISHPPTCSATGTKYSQLLGNGSKVVAKLSGCSGGQTAVYEQGAWSWIPDLPTTMYTGDYSVGVSAGGEMTANSADGSGPFRLVGTDWQSLVTNRAPSSYGITGRSENDLFAYGPGLQQLLKDEWVTVPGTETWNVTGAWQADDGTIFAFVNTGTYYLVAWRRINGVWQQDGQVPFGGRAKLVGRSATEVYAAGVDRYLYRWDGATWTQLSAALCQPLLATAAHLVGSSKVLVDCGAGMLEWDGVAFTSILPSRPTESFYSVSGVGPTNAATAFYCSDTTCYTRTQAGTTPWTGVALIPPTGPVFGPDLQHLVTLQPNGFATSNGQAAWRATSTSFTTGLSGGWTDGATAFAVKQNANPEAGAVVRCRLLP